MSMTFAKVHSADWYDIACLANHESVKRRGYEDEGMKRKVKR